MNSIFVPISVEDRLPALTEYDGLCSKTVVVIINEKSYRAPGKSWGDPAGEYIKQVYYSAYYTKDGWIWEYDEHMDIESRGNLTHWLEESPIPSRAGEVSPALRERDEYRTALEKIEQNNLSSNPAPMEIARSVLYKYPAIHPTPTPEVKEEVECSTDNPCSYCRSLDETADGQMNPIALTQALEETNERLLDKTIMLEAAEQALDQVPQISIAFGKWLLRSGYRIPNSNPEYQDLWSIGHKWPTELKTSAELYVMFLADSSK